MKIPALNGVTIRVPEMDTTLGGFVWQFMRCKHECRCDECVELRELMTPKNVPLIPFMVSFSQACTIMKGVQTLGWKSDRALCFAGRLCDAIGACIACLDFHRVPSRMLHEMEQSHGLSRDRIDRDRIRLWFRMEFAQYVTDRKELDFLMVQVDRLGAEGMFTGHAFDHAFKSLVFEQSQKLLEQLRGI